MKRLLSVFILVVLGFQLQAQDTLRTFTFASDDMTGITYGSAGTLTSNDMIGGEYTDAHSFTSSSYSYWNRIADSAALYGSIFSSTFWRISNYGFQSYFINYLPGHNNGFMLASMWEAGSPVSGQHFNTYIGFPAIALPASTQVIEVAWKQIYYKYYDQCFVDYKVNGQWQTMEVNVTGIDVDINSFGPVDAHYTLPLAAAQESSLELRLRYYSSGRGSGFGYCWAVDDFTVISGEANQWQVAPEHFVDGKYDRIPQGMQIPLTWYSAVKNTGSATQTGVGVTMQHTSPAGVTSTFLNEAMSPLVNHGAFDTLVVNPRGFYNSQYPGWLDLGPNYGQASISPIGNNGLPTTEAGLNTVKTTVASNALSYPYDEHTYTVTTADDNGISVWGYGNGVLAGGMDGFCYGYTTNGYISNNPGESNYSAAGYLLQVRLTTGNTIPVDTNGDPWVFRGMEMVVSPTCTAPEGTELTPMLYKVIRMDEESVSFENVATGVSSYTVTAGDYTSLASGYLMPGQYNTLRIMFPSQPVLEPNTSYLIGYQLANDADFSLAVNSYSYSNGDSLLRFRDDSVLAPYARSFQPDNYDIRVYAYSPYNGYSNFWSGYNIHHTPMMSALVGPAVEMPKALVTVNTTGAEVFSDATGADIYGGTVIDTLVMGVDASYWIVPEMGYQISDILVDGVSILDGSYADYDEWSSNYTVYDNLGNVVETYPYSYYNYTFYNIGANHTLTVTTSPMPQKSVTFNCPSNHATVYAYPNGDESEASPCGTHSYYCDWIQYVFSLDAGYTIDSLVVDGTLVDLGGTNSYTLNLGNTSHVLSLTVAPINCTVSSFPYNQGFENANEVDACWSTVNDGDYDELGWQMDIYNPDLTHAGNAMMISFSQYDYYDDASGNYYTFDVNPDNWLISPSIQIPAGEGAVLGWYAAAFYGSEDFSVYVSTTGTSPSDFTLLGTYNVYGGYYYDANYYYNELDLSAYAGQTVHIAFRHTDGDYVLLLDDVKVEVGNTVSISCTGNATGYVKHSDESYSAYFDNDRCGTTEMVETGFLASYDFLPSENATLAHLYVNDVDRMSDVVTHTSGTSVSYTFSFTVPGSTTLNPVFNYPSYDVTINCTGDGQGTVYNWEDFGIDLCGGVDEVRQGFIASYEFIPTVGCEMTHLYVNGVDRMSQVESYSSGSSVSLYAYSFAVTSAVTMEPYFSRIPYTVTATSADPTMGMVTGGGTYYYDSTATITATPMPHYRFSHWLVVDLDGDTMMIDQELLDMLGIDMVLNPIQFPVYSDMTLIGVFAPETYTITVVANNVLYGSVEGGGEFTYLEPVVVSATAYSGYHFAMWSNGAVHNPYTFPASENLELTAIFVSDDDTSSYFYVSVTANDSTMGTVDGSGVYSMGETATLVATPYEGFKFVQWNDGNADNPRTVTVTSSINYIAYFAPVTGIGDVEAVPAKVYSYGDCIFVANAEGRSIRVFDIAGRQLTHVDRATGTMVFNMQHTGVYIVTVDNKAYRVMVKK